MTDENQKEQGSEELKANAEEALYKLMNRFELRSPEAVRLYHIRRYIQHLESRPAASDAPQSGEPIPDRDTLTKGFRNLIALELQWCISNPNYPGKREEFEQGFMGGLKQSLAIFEKALNPEPFSAIPELQPAEAMETVEVRFKYQIGQVLQSTHFPVLTAVVTLQIYRKNSHNSRVGYELYVNNENEHYHIQEDSPDWRADETPKD